MVKLSVVACVIAAVVAVQGPATVPAAIETKHLTIATSMVAAGARGRGRRVSLVVDVAPKPKMHVYAPGQDGYITISLTLEPAAAVVAAKAQYPAGEKILMELLHETQVVYAKPFRITQDVTLQPSATPVTIKGTVRYQACDDKICYLPANVPVQWTIKPL